MPLTPDMLERMDDMDCRPLRDETSIPYVPEHARKAIDAGAAERAAARSPEAFIGTSSKRPAAVE